MNVDVFSALRDAQADTTLFRAILDALDDGILVTDENGKIVAWNRAAARLIGLPEGARPEAWDDALGIFLPDERTPCPPQALPLFRALGGERVNDVELFVKNRRAPQGVHASLTAWPIEGEQGRIRGGVLVLHNMTSRKLKEVAFGHIEARLRAIIANAPNVAIEGYDEHGRVLHWNHAAEHLFGWSEEEAVGKTLEGMLLDVPAAKQFADKLDEVARTGQPSGPAEWLCRRKDGGEIWVYSTIFSIPTITGGSEFVCMDVDVTPLKHVENQIREHAIRLEALSDVSQTLGEAGLAWEELLSAIARSASDGVGDACALYLLSDDALWLDAVMLHHPDPAVERELLQRARASRLDATAPPWQRVLAGQPPHAERLGREETGTLSPPMFEMDANGGGVGVVMAVPLVAQERTIGVLVSWRTRADAAYSLADRQLLAGLADRAALAIDNAKLFRKAQEAIAARDEFLAIASHELQTPLTPLKLHLERLLRDARMGAGEARPERLAAALEVAYRQAARLAALIDRLLDVSRIKAGKLEVCLEDVELGALVREVVTRLSREGEEVGSPIALRMQTPVVGTWDRLRLDQVVTNLLANAIKYGRGKPIEVELDADEQTARLTIRDHGAGIALEEQMRIFERFERSGSRQSYEGLGLGLWIVRQIVEAHGGSVHIESAPGAGSAFRVELPRRGRAPVGTPVP